MSAARSSGVICAAALAVALGGCGQSTKLQAGAVGPGGGAGRGVVDDPRTQHLACLRNLGLPLRSTGQTDIDVGPPGASAHVVFEPTPGAAQAAQIEGGAQGAEAIGSALLYPQAMAEAHLSKVESCLALSVKG